MQTSAEALNQSLLYYKPTENLAAYPGVVFQGDRGCSPSSLLSFLTLEKQVGSLILCLPYCRGFVELFAYLKLLMQVVPVEEVTHYAIRLLQTPSTSPVAVPDNVVWLDLEVNFASIAAWLPCIVHPESQHH